MIANAFNEGRKNWLGTQSLASVQEVLNVTRAAITRIQRMKDWKAETTVSAGEMESQLLERIDNIMARFHVVALQLRKRHCDRTTLDIADEYDVQDLFHALLRQHFDDIREEEPGPSFAGAGTRTDFLLPKIDTFIEIKKTRAGLGAKVFGEQIIIDIARYKAHPQCRRLICFIYDPEGRISNPAGIEHDLMSRDHGIEVQVCIYPKSGVPARA